MAEQIARIAVLELIYRGIDLGGYCVRAEYTDHADGAMDEFRCTLQDRDNKWQAEWLPVKGDAVSATIHCHHWWRPNDHHVLNCGKFEIGEITLTGPPDQVEIQASAIKVKSSGRMQKKSKPWEKTTLQAIAAHVAEKTGLQLAWEGADKGYDRVDQREESDAAFLRRLCRETGNGLKTVDGKLFVYACKTWEQRGPHAVVARGQERIKTYRFATATQDCYRGCVVTYSHPELKRTIKGEFFPPDAPPNGDVLCINRAVKDEAEAMRMAMDRLRSKNRWEVKADFTLVGDVYRRATQVLLLEGFGRFSGRYFTDKAVHALDAQGGYETSLNLRRVLDY